MKRHFALCIQGMLCLAALQVTAGYTVLHNFAGGASDGKTPYFGQFVKDFSILYGMTYQGGDGNLGTIFKMNDDGTGFVLLHEFAGGANDGAYPYDSLTLDGSALFGMTRGGGDGNFGTVFKINPDGSGFTLLHEFAGGGNDGAYPYGSLTIRDAKMYGMTNRGGDTDNGTIFSFIPTEQTSPFCTSLQAGVMTEVVLLAL